MAPGQRWRLLCLLLLSDVVSLVFRSMTTICLDVNFSEIKLLEPAYLTVSVMDSFAKFRNFQPFFSFEFFFSYEMFLFSKTLLM